MTNQAYTLHMFSYIHTFSIPVRIHTYVLFYVLQ